MGGVEVGIKNLSKSFGSSNIWNDVTLTLPAGEVSVLLGPSGTGKSVLLKSIIGLLKPEKGSIFIHDTDLVRCSESKLYDIRKLFGVLFQDGALFGSMNLYDNIAFPLREHTRKGETEIKNIVMEKLDMVGLTGAEDKLPGEISGGMKKRAGLARALVLDPEIILVDEPDSGLDPVRTAYLNQLIVDLNTQLDATILIVTHHLGTARSLPDNIGMLFRRNLVMFGPREVLLTSEEPVVQQFLQGRRVGPIGMSEEKDTAQMEAELEELKRQGGSAESEESFIDPQLEPSEGLGERAAVQRRKDRVMQVLHTLPEKAQTAILEQLTEEDQERYGISREQDRTELIEVVRDDPPSDADPFGHQAMADAGTDASEGEGGSGDPDGDPEARKEPPAPPESDEPLVGVPVDDHAGGTVVLPQAGEHTKSDEEKADESGAAPDDDGDDDGSGESGSDGDREHRSESDEQGDDDGDGASGESGSDTGRERRSEEQADQAPALVSMERAPDREQQADRSSDRDDDRAGWAASNGERRQNGEQQRNAEQQHGEQQDGEQREQDVVVSDATEDGSAKEGAKHLAAKSAGGLRRLFRRSGS